MPDEPTKDDQAQGDQPQGDEKKDELQVKVEEAQKKDAVRGSESAAADRREKKNKADEQKNEAQNKIDELTAALQRCMADLQNYKRRAEEDKMRFVKFANAELLKTLLPIIDNFDRSCQLLPEELKVDKWARGVMQTHDELMKTLEKIGVKKMETVGQKLDPNKHEAVMQGFGKKDVIVEEFEPGYTFNEETLKPAKVKVGDGNKK